jgi:G3E family GTPase
MLFYYPEGKLIRSKGHFWLASIPQFAGQWNQAGGIARYSFGGMFWKATPKMNWPDDPELLASIEKTWLEYAPRISVYWSRP